MKLSSWGSSPNINSPSLFSHKPGFHTRPQIQLWSWPFTSFHLQKVTSLFLSLVFHVIKMRKILPISQGYCEDKKRETEITSAKLSVYQLAHSRHLIHVLPSLWDAFLPSPGPKCFGRCNAKGINARRCPEADFDCFPIHLLIMITSWPSF